MKSRFLLLSTISILFFSDCTNQKTEQLNSILSDTAFVVNKDVAEKAFLEILPLISEGRKLNTFWKNIDGKNTGYNIVIGDINNDNRTDAVIDFSLVPTWEDNGGGGNAIGEIGGLVVLLNTGKKLVSTNVCNKFGGNFGARNNLKKIQNGIIFLEGKEYDDADGRCCPSVNSQTQVAFSNGELQLLKKSIFYKNEFTTQDVLSLLNKPLENINRVMVEKGYQFNNSENLSDFIVYHFSRSKLNYSFKVEVSIKNEMVEGVSTQESITSYENAVQDILNNDFKFIKGTNISITGDEMEYSRMPEKPLASSVFSFKRNGIGSCTIIFPMSYGEDGHYIFNINYSH